MRARLLGWLELLGAAGVVGLGLLVQCAAFYAFAVLPQEQSLEARRHAQAQRSAKLRPVRATTDAGSEVERFYALFPAFAEGNDQVERLHRFAAAAGLQIPKGDYRLESRSGSLAALHVSLPLHGSYANLRRFFAAVLEQMPSAAIDRLRFERKKPGEELLDAQVQITLFLRPPEGR